MQSQVDHVIAAGRHPKRKLMISSHCDTSSCQVKLNVLLLLLLLLLLAGGHRLAAAEPSNAAAPTTGSANQLSDFKLVGQVGESVQLPCLVGRQMFCGDIYFIAWYKLNSSSKSWSRIEHKTEEELDMSQPGTARPDSDNALQQAAERIRSVWPRGLAGGRRSSCPQLLVNALDSTKLAANFESNFDCGQLHISSLKLADEGQYKCEITFSDSLDFDKCPATTLSQLGVIGKCAALLAR